MRYNLQTSRFHPRRTLKVSRVKSSCLIPHLLPALSLSQRLAFLRLLFEATLITYPWGYSCQLQLKVKESPVLAIGPIDEATSFFLNCFTFSCFNFDISSLRNIHVSVVKCCIYEEMKVTECLWLQIQQETSLLKRGKYCLGKFQKTGAKLARVVDKWVSWLRMHGSCSEWLKKLLKMRTGDMQEVDVVDAAMS